jgi:hypothetical protein
VADAVGAPPLEIADQPGVGVGALCRATFPSARTLSSRSSAATWTAEAAPTLAVEYDPRDLLIAGSSAPLISFAAKRGLSAAPHSGNPAFETLPIVV